MPCGRLYVQASPALSQPENLPIYILQLMARVVPSGVEPKAVDNAVELAHRWVVFGFKDVTTKKMHAHWGLEEDES